MRKLRIGICNDLHLPFGNDRLIKLVFEIFKDQGCDWLILNGDVLDVYGCNSYGPKSPYVQQHLEDEIFAGQEFFSNLRKQFPTEKIIMLCGNHEHRLEKFILEKVPKLWNFFQLDKMMRWDDLNIEHYRYNHAYQVLDLPLFIQHSPVSYSVNGARNSLLKKLDASYIFGCSHRVDYATLTTAMGNRIECWFNGWLGDQTQEVFSYCKGHFSWQHAAGILDVIDDKFFYSQMKFVNYSTVVHGHYYEG
jgi:predicted phosphodiesterase